MYRPTITAYIVTTAQNVDRLKTHLWAFKMRGIQCYTVVNTSDQVELATAAGMPNVISCKNKAISEGRVGKYQRLSRVRNWIMDELVPEGGYGVMMNDNITGIGMLRSPDDKQDFTHQSSTEWRAQYKTPLTANGTASLLRSIVNQMGVTGASYGGIGHPSGNYYFCPRRWQYRAYVIGDFMVCRNDGERWCDKGIYLWDDWYRTCRSLATAGAVVCNRYACTLRHTVTEGLGSVGTYQVRTPYHKKDCRTLLRLFPDLVEYNQGRDDCLRLAVRSDNQLLTWREDKGYA